MWGSAAELTPILLDLVNPLTPLKLAETILFQIFVVGSPVLFCSIYLIPKIAGYQGMHPITEEERESINGSAVLSIVFGKAKRWYDHMWWSLLSTGLKTGAVLILVLITFILFTDVGWADAIKTYGSNIGSLLIFARAGGAPNGAHLISYIPLPLLGGYVAWKFRKDDPGNSYLGAVYLGILIVGFGLAIHELLWIVFYFIQYYGVLGLYAGSNFTEDIFFSIMCLMLIVAFWKYPYRKIPMKVFVVPSLGYFAFMLVWWAKWGLPVSTINNYQFGSGIYEVTKWWADPFVNSVEIISWLYIAISFGVVIWLYRR